MDWYAPTGSACSGRLGHVGLRNNDDMNTVLVCSAHFGRLRTMEARELARLERILLETFTRPALPAPECEEGVRVVYTRSRA
jgi:hypothetical protein